MTVEIGYRDNHYTDAYLTYGRRVGAGARHGAAPCLLGIVPALRVDDSAAADTVQPALARQFILEDRTSLRFLCHRGNPPAHRKDLEWLTSQENRVAVRRGGLTTRTSWTSPARS
jgi:hypothetical protein